MSYKEVLDPIIKAAVANDEHGHQLLQNYGAQLHARFPKECPTLEAGIATAKHNLAYYSGYYEDSTRIKVNKFYKLAERAGL